MIVHTVHVCSFLFLAIIIANGDCATVGKSKEKASSCKTPDGESAFCISLFSCPGLMQSLATLDHTAIKYFKQSICLGCKAGDFMVCCGEANLVEDSERLRDTEESSTIQSTLKRETPATVTESKRDKALRTLIPPRTYCGLQHTDDRPYDAPVTALDEFPWLVHIKFTDIYADYKLGDRCTGVLINSRYVLTDSLCSISALKVRLGQYDAVHKVTCLKDPQAHECNEGTIEIRIEKKIQLNTKSDVLHSLTLIRLAKNVEYSDYVRPICLPLRESHRPKTRQSLTFSGWGSKPGDTILDDAIKKRMVYNSTNMDDCTQENDYIKNYIKNANARFSCFSPNRANRDKACHGDHGGPLMYSDNKHQWYVEHVVVDVISNPVTKCENTKTLAIKVTQEIITQILENIEP